MNHHQQPKQPQNPLSPHHHQQNQTNTIIPLPLITKTISKIGKKNPPMSKPTTTIDLHGLRPNPWTKSTDPKHEPKPQHLHGPTMLNHRWSTQSKVWESWSEKGERESWFERGRKVESWDRWLKRERERDDRDWGNRIRLFIYLFGEREWE